MTEMLTEDQLHPTSPLVRETTVNLLERDLDSDEIQKFLDKISGSVPAAVARSAWIAVLIGGTLKVGDLDDPYKHWWYDITLWGGPACLGMAPGFMYTAYNSWDAFFQNVTSCHVQGYAAGGGVLQINWFISNGTPVGQFNGVLGGISAFQGGGAGKWAQK